MQITRIDLENIKSYEEASVEFVAGMNAICGENGAGKSTLLEAIGLTLFGYNPMRKQEDMLRNGAPAGAITIAFFADDEREYEIVRRFGKGATYYVYDPEFDRKLVEGSTDTQDWLSKRLGLSPDANLASLFSDAIGVPQGLLTAIFLENQTQRQAKFDRLLRVEEYRRAKDDLRETEKHLKDQIYQAEVRVKTLETRVERRPILEREIETLADQIGQDEAQQRELAAQIATERGRLEDLNARRTHVDQLSQKLTVLEERGRATRRQVQECKARLEEAQQAAAQRESAAPGHRAYLAAQAGLTELEKSRVEREQTQAEWHNAQRALDLVAHRLTAGREQLERIARAEERLIQLRPLLQQQEALERDLSVALEETRALADHQKALSRERQQFAQIENELSDLNERIAQISARRHEAEQQPALKAQLDALLSECGRINADLDQARRSLQAVAGGLCPFLKETCRNLREGISLTTYFEEQIRALQDHEQELAAQRRAADARLARANEAVILLSRLPDLTEQMQRRQRDRDEMSASLIAREGAITDLADSPARARALEAQLRELGDQRLAYAVCQEEAGKRGAVSAALEADATEHSRLKATAEALYEQLASFAGLDERIEARRAVLRQHERDYLLYVRNETAAASLPASERALLESQAALRAIETQIEQNKAELERAQAAYDAAEHARLDASLRQKESQAAAISQRLALNGERRGRLQAECEQLRALEIELETQRRRCQADVDLLALVGQMRTWIGEAGPHITLALVQEISRQAAQIYCEIMHDYSLHLSWNETYEIIVEKGGYERSFRQLSGGEQMAAAIAVRLALLKQISNIDIAFFDEPTANLDETRRSNLADQIVNVRGFSQIFVISHDDTFERVTDHVIRVYKEGDVSRVEVGPPNG